MIIFQIKSKWRGPAAKDWRIHGFIKISHLHSSRYTYLRKSGPPFVWAQHASDGYAQLHSLKGQFVGTLGLTRYSGLTATFIFHSRLLHESWAILRLGLWKVSCQKRSFLFFILSPVASTLLTACQIAWAECGKPQLEELGNMEHSSPNRQLCLLLGTGIGRSSRADPLWSCILQVSYSGGFQPVIARIETSWNIRKRLYLPSGVSERIVILVETSKASLPYSVLSFPTRQTTLLFVTYSLVRRPMDHWPIDGLDIWYWSRSSCTHTQNVKWPSDSSHLVIGEARAVGGRFELIWPISLASYRLFQPYI